MKRRLAIPAPHRRGFLTTTAALFGAVSLGGCDRFAGTEWGRRTLRTGEDANLFVQRLLLTPASLAREFPDSEISPWFKPNGTTNPDDDPYRKLAASNFTTYTLAIDGLVERPQRLSLANLRALDARTQTTRHDCVEGWSAIGKWTGVPLSKLLDLAGLKPQARYIVFHCVDAMEYELAETDEQASDETATLQQAKSESGDAKTNNPSMESRPEGADDKATTDDDGGEEPSRGKPVRYYESIDLIDAYHPQTILAYDLNGKPLPVSNGAPLRLRVERQLGYKQAKYIMRVEVVESFAGIGKGNGGYWEDNGYEWYAGI